MISVISIDQMTFKEQIKQGIPDVLPPKQEYDTQINHAPKRKEILNNLQKASSIFQTIDDLESYNMIFISSRGEREFPFWNQINGPIADALWHVGQVVTHRRTSGNPFNSKVSVFNGKVRQ